jgi:hypothetical protein
MRTAAYLTYAALTMDAAQRRIRTFYEAVNIAVENSGDFV